MNTGRNLLTALLITFGTYSLPANAEVYGSKNCFGFPAVAMTPYNQSIQTNQYVMTHENVRHNTGKTGTVLLYGPVDAFDPLPSSFYDLKLNYGYAMNGVGRASVAVQLRFVSETGRTTIIKTLRENIVGTAAHETSPAKGTLSLYDQLPSDARLNRTDGYYMVRVYLTRSSPNVSVSAIGYKLCGGID